MWQLGLLLLCIAVWIPIAADGDTSQPDVSALNVLYSTLNSPPQLTGWSSNGGDPCGQSWRGITCSGSAVTEVKLSGLGLNGTLGYMLASMVSLTTFDLSSNNIGFGSTIPYGLPPNVQRLDLSGNAFDGPLPYSVSLMSSLKYLNVSHNQLDGILSDIFSKLSSLCTLDISYNNFSGVIPSTFSALSSLTTLFLQNNQFIGTIDVLVDLPLEYLNIMNNHFTGGIPDQLKRVKNIQIDGSSWNSGPAAPASPGRKTNPGQNSGGGQIPSSKGVGRKSNMGMAGVAGATILGLVIVSVVVYFIINKKSKPALNKKKLQNGHPYTPRESDETSGNIDLQKASNTAIKTGEYATLANLRPPPSDRYKSSEEDDTSNKITKDKTNIAPICAKAFSVADLQLATDSFNMENVIGEGSLGRVYRAQFDDGKVLAVKKISPSAFPRQSSEDFLELVSCLSQLRHPNVTALAGYCCEHGQHLLIFEFLSNGSLQELLHYSDELINPLSWNSRIKIALGTARALEYLHEVCFPPIIHKNFKSGNILLDEELNPRLSDSGFSSLNFTIEFEGLDQNMGFGYSAPEVMSGQYTVKSDIYSFGVVMLELLTGRKPFDSSRHRSEQSLVQWATPQLHDIDALDKMVDPTLKGMYPAKSLSRFADVIALCVQPEPEFRPPMSEVVQSLIRLVQRANTGSRTGTADDA